MSSLQIAIQVILLFFVLVTIHEWGHFYFAKKAGILVREFAIGFGPKIFSYKKGETRYTLRLLPIGGFVRMAGEDPEVVQINPGQAVAVGLENEKVKSIFLDQLDLHERAIRGIVEQIDVEKNLTLHLKVEDQVHVYAIDPQAFMISKGKETQIAPWNRQFGSKTVGQRALSIFAGPFMNFILAFALFITVMVIVGVPKNVKLQSVEPGSAAAQAHLQADDIIVQINQQPIGADINKVKDLIVKSANQKMDWLVQRDDKQIPLAVTPKQVDGHILVGVILTSDTRSATMTEALGGGWDHMVIATKQILTGFKALATGQFSWDDLGGPVRIVEVTGQQASAGTAQYIFWAAVLSLYLGMFNLLPFPALDGSRLVFLAFEAVRGKPVDPNRESMVHFVGFAMLMLLMIAVTYNDIVRLIKG